MLSSDRKLRRVIAQTMLGLPYIIASVPNMNFGRGLPSTVIYSSSVALIFSKQAFIEACTIWVLRLVLGGHFRCDQNIIYEPVMRLLKGIVSATSLLLDTLSLTY